MNNKEKNNMDIREPNLFRYQAREETQPTKNNGQIMLYTLPEGLFLLQFKGNYSKTKKKLIELLIFNLYFHLFIEINVLSFYTERTSSLCIDFWGIMKRDRMYTMTAKARLSTQDFLLGCLRSGSVATCEFNLDSVSVDILGCFIFLHTDTKSNHAANQHVWTPP